VSGHHKDGVRLIRVVLILLVAPCFGRATLADDWPHWRGPHHNGTSAEDLWRHRWGKDGKPQVVWRASVGTGYSAVAIREDRLYTIGNVDDQDTVYCLHAVTGETIWTHRYECPLDNNFFEGGPTSTPTIDGSRVYAISRPGDLFCFDASNGRVIWSHNVAKKTGNRVPGWGFASSPLIHGDLLLLNVGEAGLALDKRSGEVRWSSADKDAGYATLVVANHKKAPEIIVASARFIIAVDLHSGRENWRYRWLTSFGANAADPIVVGENVFMSSGYNRGAILLKETDAEPEVVWENKEMRTQMNGCVLVDDHLFGFDGNSDAPTSLKCIEWATGKVCWADKDVGFGALMAADDYLIVLTERGELLVAPADRAGFKPTGRLSVLDGPCWTVPVLANGRVYCRSSAGELACVDVQESR